MGYGVGKAAVDKLSADMAYQLRQHNISSVSVWPSLTRTEKVMAYKEQYDLKKSYSPLFTGLAVAALAADPKIIEKTGKSFLVIDLASEYGFSDTPSVRPAGTDDRTCTMNGGSVVLEANETVSWLLKSDNPSVRFLTVKELVGEPEDSKILNEARLKIPSGSFARLFLSGQQPDGGFGVHPYTKWIGAHWRLVSLAELGFPLGDPRIALMANQVLEWLGSSKHRDPIKRVEDRVRAHASMEGNALAACSRMGLAEDPRVKGLADSLVEWQWPDGGWNCDPRPEAEHSSFNETLIPIRGLVEYQIVTGDDHCTKTIDRAIEFLLKHELYKSCTTGRIVRPEWLELYYPAYWHYGILEGLLTISRARRIGDPRAKDALDLIARKMGANWTWSPDGFYWLRPGEKAQTVEFGEDYSEPPMPEVVDWGREGPSEMLTLNAARVLNDAGRLEPPN